LSECRSRPSRRLLAAAALALALLAAAPALALDVTLDTKVETPAHPLVRGTTNLPDGALLAVTLSQTAGGFTATTMATVQGGGFTAGPFNRDGRDLEPGGYRIEVVMEMSVQPKPVRLIVGSHGMQMEGDLIRQGSTGQLVVYSTAFTSSADPHAGANPPGDAIPRDAWVLNSCTDQVEFLNRSIRAKAVGGHELQGGERDKWIADCVRQTRQIPPQDTVIP